MRATAEELLRLMRRKPKEPVKSDLRNMPPPPGISDSEGILIPGAPLLVRVTVPNPEYDPYVWFEPKR